MNTNIIECFKKCLTDSIIDIDTEITKRIDGQIRFEHILYSMSQVLGNEISYATVNLNLKIKKIVDVKTKTLIVRKNQIDTEHFEQLNNNLLDHIYDGCKRRILAVDGTYIPLLKSLSNEGLRLSRNGNHCTTLISALFDVKRKIPINYRLYKHTNERAALESQLKYINRNDILIMDRGYYSLELLGTLDKLGIKTIFRLRNNLDILLKLKKIKKRECELTEDQECAHKTIPFRVIKYKIKRQIYYLGTTIYDKDIDYFKDIYWRRWKIEINFRHSKYNLSLRKIQSKTVDAVEQDIYIHNFIFIVTSFFQYQLQVEVDEKYTISTTSSLYITVNKLLYLLIFKKTTVKTLNKILRILNITKESLVLIRNDREYLRIKLRQGNKWGPNGNKYGDN